MNNIREKQLKRIRRHRRTRAKINGTANVPRLSVFRSNKSMFVQLIDDAAGITIASANSKEIKKEGKKLEIAHELGKIIAKKASEKKITKIVFDKSGYKYHGRVKAVAEGAREGGLVF